MAVIGILFLGLVIYVIYSQIETDRIRKEKQKQWEPYHGKRQDKKDVYREALDEMMLQASSPYYTPGDLPDSVEDYVKKQKN